MAAEEGGLAGGALMGDLAERVFPCIKLRGLPFDSNDDEIRVFLVRPPALPRGGSNWPRGGPGRQPRPRRPLPDPDRRPFLARPRRRDWTPWTSCCSSGTGGSRGRRSSCWDRRLRSLPPLKRTSRTWAGATWRSSRPRSWCGGGGGGGGERASRAACCSLHCAQLAAPRATLARLPRSNRACGHRTTSVAMPRRSRRACVAGIDEWRWVAAGGRLAAAAVQRACVVRRGVGRRRRGCR